MMPLTTLAMAGGHHASLRAHLFPGDGLEAAAILLCARGPGGRERHVVREILPVPYCDCHHRAPDFISWPGAWLERAVEDGEKEGLTIILTHSHPGGLLEFSELDDASDQEAVGALLQAYGGQHGSAIMTPDGSIRARLYGLDMAARAIDLVTVAGDDISLMWGDGARRPVAFTGGMTAELGRLVAVVIGVSGTGSVIAEQAARLGFGRVILIDFDKIERKNLNRILNSKLSQAATEALKVAAFAEAIVAYRGAGVAVPIAASIDTRDAVLAASQGDILFSCVDSLHASGGNLTLGARA